MPGHFRHGYGFYRGGPQLKGAIWMIGLGILFLTGDWWPGIMILIGISAIVEGLWRNPEPRQKPAWEWDRPTPAQPQEKPEQPPAPPVASAPAPAPTDPAPRLDLVPSNCPSCGAPVRGMELKWTSSQTATCNYCGSTIRAR